MEIQKTFFFFKLRMKGSTQNCVYYVFISYSCLWTCKQTNSLFITFKKKPMKYSKFKQNKITPYHILTHIADGKTGLHSIEPVTYG
jgi:hypothetical protein